MKKSLVNVFVYGDGTHVDAVGWCVYEKAGSYEELTTFLQSRVRDDHRIAQREDLTEPMLRRIYARNAEGSPARPSTRPESTCCSITSRMFDNVQ